jgi:hypothetical protein
MIKNPPPKIEDDMVLYHKNFILDTDKSYNMTDKTGKLIMENKLPVSKEKYFNDLFLNTIATEYGMNFEPGTKVFTIVRPENDFAYIKINTELLEKLERFGYDYQQNLIPPTEEGKDAVEPDDFTEESTPDLSLKKEPTTTPTTEVIKPGVQELFESNLELANQVYSALGFNNISDVTLDKPRFNPDNPEATSYPIKINGKYAGVISVNNEGYISSSIGMAGVELEKEFQGKGYGTKVYLALANKLMEEGKTLKSEAFGKEDINDSASKVWKSLLDKGLAVDKGDYFEVASKPRPPEAIQLTLDFNESKKEQYFQDFYSNNQNIDEDTARDFFDQCML